MAVLYLFCNILNVAVRNLSYVASNDWKRVNTEMDGMWKEAVVT
jgi:hypothetical protein